MLNLQETLWGHTAGRCWGSGTHGYLPWVVTPFSSLLLGYISLLLVLHVLAATQLAKPFGCPHCYSVSQGLSLPQIRYKAKSDGPKLSLASCQTLPKNHIWSHILTPRRRWAVYRCSSVSLVLGTLALTFLLLLLFWAGWEPPGIGLSELFGGSSVICRRNSWIPKRSGWSLPLILELTLNVMICPATETRNSRVVIFPWLCSGGLACPANFLIICGSRDWMDIDISK